MHILFFSILHIYGISTSRAAAHFPSHFPDQIVFNLKAQIARKQQIVPIRASGPAVVQALGFKCIACNAEFANRRGADCHRRHPTCFGTACADPSNIRSLSLTERPDVSVGILRHHAHLVLPSYRHWGSSASRVTLNLQTDAVLTVTAATPHALARRHVGVCRPKQHPITFSDRTPWCFGWNSSPSQCCASR